MIEAHSSVAVVLYHKDLDAFLLVRQFRPAVYACRLREAKAEERPLPDRSAGVLSVQVGLDVVLCGVSSLQGVCRQDCQHIMQGKCMRVSRTLPVW